MTERENRFIATMLLSLFVLFFSANTFFVHVHDDDSGRIVHSHPYMPGTGHSHTCASFQSIALANSALNTMEGAAENCFSTPECDRVIFESFNIGFVKISIYKCKKLRAPPVV